MRINELEYDANTCKLTIYQITLVASKVIVNGKSMLSGHICWYQCAFSMLVLLY